MPLFSRNGVKDAINCLKGFVDCLAGLLVVFSFGWLVGWLVGKLVGG